MTAKMKRREFITLLGGAAAWPLAARAQQPERMRRIGVLTPLPADHPDAKARHAAFLEALRQLGWSEGHNVRIEARWLEVLALMMQGKSNKAICRVLDLSEATVEIHVSAILRALKAANRTEAVIAAGALGFSPKPDAEY